jgi:hypothetical protein
MKNLKPSQLPEGTVIEVPKYGTYLKVSDGVWEEVYSGCCSSTGRISDDGRHSEYGDKYGWSTDENADDIFQDFKIVSLPYSIFEAMATIVGVDWLSTEAEVLTYVMGFIKDSEDDKT